MAVLSSETASMNSSSSYLPPTVIDTRSLAAFRILVGLYMMYDIFIRVRLKKYDLAWYTDTPQERSFLLSTDTPHKAPLHQFWFQRGTIEQQIIMYGITFILSLFFCLGLKCNGLTKLTLWVFQVAQHSLNMWISDGSGSFFRHLLFWCCFLPLTDRWSLDAVIQQRRQQRRSKTGGGGTRKNLPTAVAVTVSGLPCLAILLQVVLMYVGTVLNRFADVSTMFDSQWMPPALSAVHLAMSGSFATRQNLMVHLIRSNPAISKTMTAIAMITEFGAPIACLLAGNKRHIPAAILFQQHAGLYVTLQLPNWQIVGMICPVLWIPSHIWDQYALTRILHVDDYKKTDGDDGTTTTALQLERPRRLSPNPISKFVQYFFFLYMIYNWLGIRGWIPQHENGDIGEGLRLSQNWIMFGKVSKTAHTTKITGVLPSSRTDNASPMNLDLMYYVKTGLDRLQDPEEFVPENMSDRYPSTFWERALYQWSSSFKRDAAQHMCSVLCVLVNEDRAADGLPVLSHVEMTFQHLKILPPGSARRYAEQRSSPDTVVEVECSSSGLN